MATAIELPEGGIVVVSQKIVSKGEGRIRVLADVEVGEDASALGRELGKDPAIVQLALDESRRIVRAERDVLICETHAGWICANAGIDASNVPADGSVALLPADADASARRIRAEARAASSATIAVIVADSFGRPWRVGQTDVAIGCAGIAPVDDRRGRPDRDGRELTATVIAIVDQLAAVADLTREKAAGVPVALVRGLEHLVLDEEGPGAVELQRAAGEDLFR